MTMQPWLHSSLLASCPLLAPPQKESQPTQLCMQRPANAQGQTEQWYMQVEGLQLFVLSLAEGFYKLPSHPDPEKHTL